MSARGRRQSSE